MPSTPIIWEVRRKPLPAAQKWLQGTPRAEWPSDISVAFTARGYRKVGSGEPFGGGVPRYHSRPSNRPKCAPDQALASADSVPEDVFSRFARNPPACFLDSWVEMNDRLLNTSSAAALGSAGPKPLRLFPAVVLRLAGACRHFPPRRESLLPQSLNRTFSQLGLSPAPPNLKVTAYQSHAKSIRDHQRQGHLGRSLCGLRSHAHRLGTGRARKHHAGIDQVLGTGPARSLAAGAAGETVVRKRL